MESASCHLTLSSHTDAVEDEPNLEAVFLLGLLGKGEHMRSALISGISLRGCLGNVTCEFEWLAHVKAIDENED